MVVGLVRAAWHAPLFFIDGTSRARSSWAWFTLQAVALAGLVVRRCGARDLAPGRRVRWNEDV